MARLPGGIAGAVMLEWLWFKISGVYRNNYRKRNRLRGGLSEFIQILPFMKSLKIFFTVLAGVIILTACSTGGEKKSSYPVTVGNLTFKEPPVSLVSLSPALTETVYALGYGSKLVGVSNYCDRPTVTGELKRCGSALAPDIDAIKALAPKLILSSAALAEADLIALQQLDINVLVVPRANDLEGIYKNYETLAKSFRR